MLKHSHLDVNSMFDDLHFIKLLIISIFELLNNRLYSLLIALNGMVGYEVEYAPALEDVFPHPLHHPVAENKQREQLEH